MQPAILTEPEMPATAPQVRPGRSRQDGYAPFSTARRTTVHEICDARDGFPPFVLTIFTRGGGAAAERLAWVALNTF